MKKGVILSQSWEYIGALLANEDDNEQASFFKAFIKECESWGTHFQVQQQLAFINRKLTKEEKRTLSMITYIEGENE